PTNTLVGLSSEAALNLLANQTIRGLAGDSGADSSAINLSNNSTLTISGLGGTAFGVIGGQGSVVWEGGSTVLNFRGANTYTGGTTLNGGTFLAMNTIGSATGTGPVTVNATAGLRGTGFITGDVTLNSGAWILGGGGSNAFGNGGAGNLTLNNLNFTDGSLLRVNLHDAAGTAGVSAGWSLITLTGELDLANALTLQLASMNEFGTAVAAALNFDPDADYSFDLITAAG